MILAFTADGSVAAPFDSGTFQTAAAFGVTVWLALLPVSFVLCLTGYLSVASTKQPEEIKKELVRIMVVIALIAFFPPLVAKSLEAFNALTDQLRAQNFKVLEQWSLTDTDKPSSLDLSGQIAYFVMKVCAPAFKTASALVGLFQEAIIIILVAFSPIPLGFMAIKKQEAVGYTFLMTVLGICLWKVGFLMCDMILVSLGPIVMGFIGGAAAIQSLGVASTAAAATAAGVTGGGVVIAGIVALAVGLLAIFITQVALYFASALSIYLFLSGANPAFAALGGAVAGAKLAGAVTPAAHNTATNLAGGAVKGISNAGGAAKEFASAGTQMAAPVAQRAAFMAAMATTPVAAATASGSNPTPVTSSGPAVSTGPATPGSAPSMQGVSKSASFNQSQAGVRSVAAAFQANRVASMQSAFISKAKK